MKQGKHRYIRLPAVLLALLMIVGAAVIPASAVEMGDDMTFGHISEYKDFNDLYPGAADAIAEGAYNLNKQVDISSYGIPYSPENAKKLFATVIHTHPELFYVSGSFSWGGKFMNGRSVLSYLNLHWGKVIYDDSTGQAIGEDTYSDAQVLQMRAEFRARAQWYLNKLDDNMSDFEKALVLHDELALNSEYLLSGETYDLMVNGQGKCYGYSEAYSYLLAQVGIDSEIIESEPMFHQWNKVKIDGHYYHVDVTWDDASPDKPGFVDHTYFLLSDAAIESAGDANYHHYGYTTDFPSVDTRFDDMGYHKINTQLCRVGSDVYAVDNNSVDQSDTGRKLLLYDLAADSFQVVHSFGNVYWSTGSGSVWIDAFIGLQEFDGYLYMNTEHEIYVYDTVSGEFSLFAEDTYEKSFYGVRIIDGALYAVMATSPAETGTLQYIDECTVRSVPVPEPVMGDLDGDGVLTVEDVTVLLRFLAEYDELTPEQLLLADVTGDGKVNVLDITAMQRIIAEVE